MMAVAVSRQDLDHRPLRLQEPAHQLLPLSVRFQLIVEELLHRGLKCGDHKFEMAVP
jgi:hypothetical protein